MLTIETLSLESGITITDPVMVVNNLMESNSTWTSEVLGKKNVLEKSSGGNQVVNFRVTIFAGLAAFNEGKPAVTDLSDSNGVKNYSFNKADYQDKTPREAAYAFLAFAEPKLAGSIVVDGVDI